jgi:hypothetical protein
LDIDCFGNNFVPDKIYGYHLYLVMQVENNAIFDETISSISSDDINYDRKTYSKKRQ